MITNIRTKHYVALARAVYARTYDDQGCPLEAALDGVTRRTASLARALDAAWGRIEGCLHMVDIDDFIDLATAVIARTYIVEAMHHEMAADHVAKHVAVLAASVDYAWPWTESLGPVEDMPSSLLAIAVATAKPTDPAAQRPPAVLTRPHATPAAAAAAAASPPGTTVVEPY